MELGSWLFAWSFCFPFKSAVLEREIYSSISEILHIHSGCCKSSVLAAGAGAMSESSPEEAPLGRRTQSRQSSASAGLASCPAAGCDAADGEVSPPPAVCQAVGSLRGLQVPSRRRLSSLSSYRYFNKFGIILIETCDFSILHALGESSYSTLKEKREVLLCESDVQFLCICFCLFPQYQIPFGKT